MKIASGPRFCANPNQNQQMPKEMSPYAHMLTEFIQHNDRLIANTDSEGKIPQSVAEQAKDEFVSNIHRRLESSERQGETEGSTSHLTQATDAAQKELIPHHKSYIHPKSGEEVFPSPDGTKRWNETRQKWNHAAGWMREKDPSDGKWGTRRTYDEGPPSPIFWPDSDNNPSK